MSLKLTNDVKTVIQKAVELLNGAARRVFMASVVKQMDRGGQRLASVELGWNRPIFRVFRVFRGFKGFCKHGRPVAPILSPDELQHCTARQETTDKMPAPVSRQQTSNLKV